MEDLQIPAGRFVGQDDMCGKGMVWESGITQFRSHPAQ